MSQTAGIALHALIAVLALASAILRFWDGELLPPALLLLLAALNAAAVGLYLKRKGKQEK